MIEERGTQKRTREETIFLNKAGRIFLKALFGSLRMIQIHDSKNQVFNEPISQMLKSSAEIVEAEGHAEFQMIEDQFFLNRLWIKPIISERDTLYSLSDAFEKEGLGGITIRTITNTEHLRLLLASYHKAQGPTAGRAAEINKFLEEGKVEEIEVHRLIKIQDNIQIDLPLHPTVYSTVVGYAKILLSLREFSRSAVGDEQISALRKAQRMICELIDLCDKYPKLFGLLSLFKNFDSYFFHHCVNVLVLSLLMAKNIGMGRREMVDLGMGALFFDAGKLALPNDLLQKERELSEEEWNLIRRHPIESAATFLNLGYMNESVAERALIAYQHHWATRAPNAYPRPRRAMKPSIMSEIVGIMDRYDALTCNKVYRTGLLPQHALRLMAAEHKKGHYRDEIFNAFIRLMSPLPIGSWVSVDGKKEGIVLCPPTVVYVPAEDPVWSAGEWVELDPATASSLEAKAPPPEAYSRAVSEAFKSIKQNSILIGGHHT